MNSIAAFIGEELMLVVGLAWNLFFIVSGIIIVPLMYLWHFPMAVFAYVAIASLIFLSLTEQWATNKTIRVFTALLLTNAILYVFILWHYKGIDNALRVLDTQKIWGTRMAEHYHSI